MNNNVNVDNLIHNSFKSINYLNSLSNFYKVNSIKLNILYFNAISIRNKWDEIISFLNSFKCQIHCIIITETRLYREENKFFNIQNYISYHSNRVYDRWSGEGRGGGVAIYVHSSLTSTLIHEEWRKC